MKQERTRVLVIEDNEADLRMIREMLGASVATGFELVSAQRLSEGLERLAEEDIDVVVLDLNLPDSRGLETLTALHERSPDVAIVVLSGLESEEFGVQAVRAGADDYLVKGNWPEGRIPRALLYAIERKRTRRELLLIRTAVNNATDAVLMTDPDGRAAFANIAFERLFGRTLEDVNEEGVEALFADEAARRQIAGAIRSGRPWQGEVTMLGREGTRLPVAVRATAIADGPGAILYSFTDITERTRAEDALRRSEERYRRLVQRADSGITTVDANGVFLQANRQAEQEFGVPSKQLVGKTLWDVLPKAEADSRMADVRQVIEGGQDNTKDILRNVNDEQRWYTVHLQPLTDPDGTVTSVHMFSRDITQQKLTEERLLYEATHDALTGLFSRRYFMERLGGAIRSAKRYRYALSLCVCDLDNFKTVNDVYGHVAGDKVLARFGELIANELRADDIAGRYGGDEFWIILPHTSAEEAGISVQRIGDGLERMVFRAETGEAFAVTATFGLSELTSRDTTEHDLLVAADQALYQGKEAGGNRFVIKRP